jgi:hypothetical protein
MRCEHARVSDHDPGGDQGAIVLQMPGDAAHRTARVAVHSKPAPLLRTAHQQVVLIETVLHIQHSQRNGSFADRWQRLERVVQRAAQGVLMCNEAPGGQERNNV